MAGLRLAGRGLRSRAGACESAAAHRVSSGPSGLSARCRQRARLHVLHRCTWDRVAPGFWVAPLRLADRGLDRGPVPASTMRPPRSEWALVWRVWRQGVSTSAAHPTRVSGAPAGAGSACASTGSTHARLPTADWMSLVRDLPSSNEAFLAAAAEERPAVSMLMARCGGRGRWGRGDCRWWGVRHRSVRPSI